MDVYYWASYLANLLSCGWLRKAPKTSAPLHDSSELRGSFNLHDERSTGDCCPITTTDYARRCRAIMGLYKNLCNLGVHTSFDLPRVVVIGSQSSGKSSLVEAVSGINVPRDSGTCTRCPMECTMSSDAKLWSCSIEIRREYEENDRRLRCPTVDRFGPVINKKATVELWIRRAQAAVLSASQNYSDFYNMSEDDLRALPAGHRRFSRNTIHVTIKDPDATDLSFVDLPGLITNDDLMDTVRSMVEEHIRGPSTLIVIAMPMTDDYQNMQAVRLAKQANVDPDGNRTIGVLTKPDVLKPGDIGALSSWSEVLKGNKYQTKHGYYCVCLHDDEDRARGLSQQQEEKIFFNSEPPWNQLDQTRFGVPNFVKFVSTLLVQQIDKSVPDLRRRTRTELSRCERELAGLPPVNSDDPWTVIMDLVKNFSTALKETISGEKEESFVQSNRKIYSDFKEDILETTPDFRPFEGEDFSEYPCYVPNCQMESCRHMEPKGLEYVRRIIQQYHTWELPKHAPYKFRASCTLIRECTSLWADPAHRCFDKVAENYAHCLRNLIQKHFGHYVNLKQYVSPVIISERERCCKGANEMLDKILQMENDPIYTQNFDELTRQENRWREIYLQEMNRESSSGSDTSSEPSSPLSPPPASRASGGQEVPWSKEDEVGIMAIVRGYFQVTHHRITDNVPLIIEQALNQHFSDRIYKILVGTMTKDLRTGRIVLEDLLREESNLALRRDYLEDRVFQLQQVGAQLDHPDSEPISLGLDCDDSD